MIKKCVICDKEFEPYGSRQAICSLRCNQERYERRLKSKRAEPKPKKTIDGVTLKIKDIMKENRMSVSQLSIDCDMTLSRTSTVVNNPGKITLIEAIHIVRRLKCGLEDIVDY